MNQLYVIFEELNEIKIKEVKIVKDTDKQLIISCEGVSRKVLHKNLIETYVDEYIFGYDKEMLIELWNVHMESHLAYLRKQLNFVKDKVVSEEQKNELLNKHNVQLTLVKQTA